MRQTWLPWGRARVGWMGQCQGEGVPEDCGVGHKHRVDSDAGN